MRKYAMAATLALGLGGLIAASMAWADETPALSYSTDGKMNFPDYRSWVYLSTGFDMSYVDVPNRTAHIFDNVFVNRSSYEAFQKTGAWPDQTVLVLEARGASKDDPLLKDGMFQSRDTPSLEAHVKDAGKGGWTFYAFGKTAAPGAALPHTATCYACHQANAATDTTFTQFYPALKKQP